MAKMMILVLVCSLTGCSLLGPFRSYQPENKANSPHDPHYQPPPDEKPIINPRTGRPRQSGESID